MRNIILVLSILLACFTSMLIAQTPLATTPPKRMPIVTATLLDGTTVHGNLVSIDPTNVVIQINGDPKKHDPSTIPWSTIKSMSNGYTHLKVIYQWKADHKDNLCSACHGDQLVTCPTCKGTGHDLATRKDCPDCHGVGTIACNAPNCAKGQIPCPNQCLRLTVGTWHKKDGIMWRDFPAPNRAIFSVSEHHLGQVVELKNGYATGKIDICPVCGGKQTIDCAVCHGAAVVPCPDCSASNSPLCPDHCAKGQINCPTCKGTGLKPA